MLIFEVGRRYAITASVLICTSHCSVAASAWSCSMTRNGKVWEETCKTSRCPKRAQTGYDGFCKGCFRKRFPKQYAEKDLRRKKVCPVCGLGRELIGGVCKPCARARKCKGCGDVNRDPSAAVCSRCRKRRHNQGARELRLALWCRKCTTAGERDTGVCQTCFDECPDLRCNHCEQSITEEGHRHRCCEESCKVVFYLCVACRPLEVGGPNLHCKSCWYDTGAQCIVCCSKRGRNQLHYYRHCGPCHTQGFCQHRSCNRAYIGDDVMHCYSCTTAVALWCPDCCSDDQRASGLCAKCLSGAGSNCQYCWKPVGTCDAMWRKCSTEGCGRRSFHCSSCDRLGNGQSRTCKPCWRKAGMLCLICGSQPARSERQYIHSCAGCIAKLPAARHYELVRAESERYLDKISAQQQWDGTESSLQILMLPDTSTDKLPEYAPTPEYLDPAHCRLCLEPLGDTSLEAHLRGRHNGMSPQTYRRQVHRMVLAEWPQPITPQILRSRLAAFKEEMSDLNFQLSPCAVCARDKRMCKLRTVNFPPTTEDTPPEWLPWDEAQWHMYRQAWYEQLDELLNIECYLRRFFFVDDRLHAALQVVQIMKSSRYPVFQVMLCGCAGRCIAHAHKPPQLAFQGKRVSESNSSFCLIIRRCFFRLLLCFLFVFLSRT